MSLSRKLIIISLIYFAEGFPFGLIEQSFSIYFRIHGMSLEAIGWLSLVSLPYALKFLWAPAVDFLGTRRQWICAAQFLMAVVLCVLVSLSPSEPGTLLLVCLASFAVLSATQDIAIDAYSIELLKPSELGLANGFRQASYRVALVVAGGVFVALGGWIGWKFMYLLAAAILLLCAIGSLHLPPVEVMRPQFSMLSLTAPVRDFLKRPGVTHVVLFILLYKLGDMSMGPMIRPFWLARGLSTTEIGLIAGPVGVMSSICGGLAGGLFMVNFGIFHGLWMLGLLQAISNLGYAAVAAYPASGNMGIYIASGLESFCAGLGSAAFLAFLMSICRKEFSATQYALLSALFRVTGIMAGVPSGWAADKMGYADYFALTFMLSLPMFFFMPAVRRWIPTEGDRRIQRG